MSINKSFPILPHLLPKNDPRYQRWRDSLKKRPPPWNKNKTKDIDPSVNKISQTFKRKKIDNFFQWREQARINGLIPDPSIPFKKNRKLAFIIGLILGDGHIDKTPRTESVRITLGTNKPLLWKYAAKTIGEVINKKPHVKKRRYSNCVDIRIYQKNLSQRLYIPQGSCQVPLFSRTHSMKFNLN